MVAPSVSGITATGIICFFCEGSNAFSSLLELNAPHRCHFLEFFSHESLRAIRIPTSFMRATVVNSFSYIHFVGLLLYNLMPRSKNAHVHYSFLSDNNCLPLSVQICQ